MVATTNNEYTDNINVSNDFSFGTFRINAAGKVLFADFPFLRLLEFKSLEELYTFYEMNELLRKCFSPERFYVYSHKNNSEPSEFRWITKSGKRLLLQEYFNAAKDGEEILFYDCVVRDISENSILEKIFSDIRSTDNSILKAIPDFIFVVSKEGKIIENKNNYSALFPFIININGKALDELFPRETALKMLAFITRTLYSGEMETMEFVFVESNHSRYFEARFVIRNTDEAVMILRDITFQKEIEIQLEKLTAELMQSNITKDKFFSIISHDLRTPLNGILNYAEILSTEASVLTKEETKEFSDYILEIARSTIGLLNNLLEWSRLQSGKISFDPRMVGVEPLINKAIHLTHSLAFHKQIKVVHNLPENLNMYIDENMISSVFLNLIGNAIKFTRAGGQITITAEEEIDKVKFSVSDTGIGISHENVCKLFASGTSFTTLGTEKEKGTGLGLMLCKEFVKKHDGKIWVESLLGNGTTFYFTLAKQLHL